MMVQEFRIKMEIQKSRRKKGGMAMKNILENHIPGDKVRFQVFDEPGVCVGTVDRDSYGRKYIQCDDGITYYPSGSDELGGVKNEDVQD